MICDECRQISYAKHGKRGRMGLYKVIYALTYVCLIHAQEPVVPDGRNSVIRILPAPPRGRASVVCEFIGQLQLFEISMWHFRDGPHMTR